MPTLTMSAVIDEALDRYHTATQRPRVGAVGANALSASPTDVTLTLASGAAQVQPTTVLELGSELVLVTAKSADVTPVFTVSRGYLGTSVSAHVTTSSVVISPYFPRRDVRRFIERAATGPMTSFLSHTEASTAMREPDNEYIELPANVIDVVRVRHRISLTGRLADIGEWEQERHLPTEIFPTGQALRIPAYVTNEDQLLLAYTTPFEWSESPATEASTLTVSTGQDELPVLFALARMVSGREVSRLELDRVEEWNKEEAFRQGANVRLIQACWQDFYRAMDEAKRTERPYRNRPYYKMPKG